MKLDVLRHVEKEGNVTAKDLAEALKVTQHCACMALLRATRQRLVKREKNDDGEYIYSITQRGRERRAYLEQLPYPKTLNEAQMPMRSEP